MNRLLESFFDGSPWHVGEAMSAPAVEVADTKDTVVVKAQVPGVSKEQIQVTVSEGTLTIKGETKEEEKKEEKNYIRREFRYGAFSRTVPLPAGVQGEKATAQLKDGVLEITIPKSEAAQVKEIPVSA
jgi:HSP20 family protein